MVKRFKVKRKLEKWKKFKRKREVCRISIPPEMVERLGWEDGDSLTVEQIVDKVLITK